MTSCCWHVLRLQTYACANVWATLLIITYCLDKPLFFLASRHMSTILITPFHQTISSLCLPLILLLIDIDLILNSSCFHYMIMDLYIRILSWALIFTVQFFLQLATKSLYVTSYKKNRHARRACVYR